MDYPFNWWKQKYFTRHSEIDDRVLEFLPVTNSTGWLRKVRQAKLISTRRMADSLKITQPAYLRLERLEAVGDGTLKNLRRAAEILDCELVYAIRPKQKKTFSRVLWEHLIENLRFQPKNPFSLANAVNELMHDPEFRRRQGWSRNTRGEGVDYQIYFNRLRSPGRNAFRRPGKCR